MQSSDYSVIPKDNPFDTNNIIIKPLVKITDIEALTSPTVKNPAASKEK
jgi:hypothetical protein